VSREVRFSAMSLVTWDYVRCVAFISLLSFKPSEPHLSHYLRDVKGFTRDAVNNDIYPVYTYTSLVVVSLLAASEVCGVGANRIVNDKVIIVFGCLNRIVTRFLLLFGTSLLDMQLMQVTYSMGIVSEVVFQAYCLKVVSLKETQRLTAVVQASYLVSHTAAGFVGDALLRWTSFGLTGLMWISAVSVFLAAVVAMCLRSVDSDHVSMSNVPDALWRTAKSRRYWLSALWWVPSYAIYQTVYGYESSVYEEYVQGADNNGTIFAVALLMGAVSALSLSWRRLEQCALHAPQLLFVFLGGVLAVVTAIMAAWPSVEWALAGSFIVFFMVWGFGNTFFLAETRRAVQLASLAACPEREALRQHLVSVVFVTVSAMANLVQGLLTAIVFTWEQYDIAEVFRIMAESQGIWMGILLVLVVATRTSVANDAQLSLSDDTVVLTSSQCRNENMLHTSEGERLD